MNVLHLLRNQILDPHPVAVFDDLGDPLPVALPVVALVAEDADRAGFLDERRQLAEFFFRLRCLQMPGIDLVKRIKFSGARGLPALFRRAEPTQM